MTIKVSATRIKNWVAKINNGTPPDALCRCAVARALAAHTGLTWLVGHFSFNPKGRAGLARPLPADVRHAIAIMDSGTVVPPFEFDINWPQEAS